jgi:pyruvate formate lyase activating enzyme
MEHSEAKHSGIVFNIQKYSVHDGPGIRTVVFLKGCPLHCLWCSNPESMHAKPQLAYNRDKCLTFDSCMRCLETCSAGALKMDEDNRVRVDRNLCNNCLECTAACPSLALYAYGKRMKVEEVISTVEEDGIFYSRSGGGMTLSGGEPLHQADFAIAILEEARRRRINTAMETSGYCNGDKLEVACRFLNTLLFDIKTMDPQKHKALTGVSNEIILENLKKVRTSFPELPVLVRTPVIPEVNDSEEDLRRILEFIRGMPNLRFEMLPYHRLGMPKYGYLGRNFPMDGKKLSEKSFDKLLEFVKREFGSLLVNG